MITICILLNYLQNFESWLHIPNRSEVWILDTRVLICGLPQGLNSKESTCNVGDSGDTGLIPGSGRPPGGGHGNPLQYSCLENPMDRGAWPATSTGSHRVRHNWNDLARMHALWGRHHRKNILSSLSDLYFCFSTRTQIHIFWLLSLSGKYYLLDRQNPNSSSNSSRTQLFIIFVTIITPIMDMRS